MLSPQPPAGAKKPMTQKPYVIDELISAKAIAVVKRMLTGEKVTQETSGMSKGEWREFEGVLG